MSGSPGLADSLTQWEKKVSNPEGEALTIIGSSGKVVPGWGADGIAGSGAAGGGICAAKGV